MPRVSASSDAGFASPSSLPGCHRGLQDDPVVTLNDTHSPWTKSHLPIYSLSMNDDTTILQDLGQRVRKLRQQQGFSQEAFAARCGLDRTYIGGIERGERNVALRNLSVIASRLGLSLSELFEGL